MRFTVQNRGRPAVRGVPWWGVVSSAAAPVLLVTGWTVAAGLQPLPFNAVTGTVSALAAKGAADRWVMTLAFAVVGACQVVTGLALRPAAVPGRLILTAGGAVGVMVAANPEHAGGSLTHAVWAVIGFAALVAWPGGAWRRGAAVPWGLRPAVSVGAAVILLGLLAWFAMELAAGGGHVGLAERVLCVAQAGWPLVVVLSCRLPGQRHWPAITRRRLPVAAAVTTRCQPFAALVVGWRRRIGHADGNGRSSLARRCRNAARAGLIVTGTREGARRARAAGESQARVAAQRCLAVVADRRRAGALPLGSHASVARRGG